MSVVTASALTDFLASWDDQHLPSIPALEGARGAAREALDALAFPTTRTEAWKYTRLGRIERNAWSFQHAELDVDAFRIPGFDGVTAVFVNGFFRPELSSAESGAYIQLLDNSTETLPTPAADQLFDNLNAAYTTGGVHLHVPKGQSLERPLHLLHVTTGEDVIAQPHHVLHVEESANATVFATFHRAGEGKHFTNALFSGSVGANAELTLEKFQDVEDAGFLICTERVDQDRDSRFHIRTITNSGTLVRNTLHIAINGQGCETNLFGTYSPRGKEHVDNATVVDHRVPNCVSNELYKGIIWDQATGVFNGKVFVREDAQLTNAFQQNNNILMSETATMNSKPELEIYADDVQCSHGSTTGQFDEEAVFYLKARGIQDINARKMLIEAFRGEVIETIASPTFRAWVLQRLR